MIRSDHERLMLLYALQDRVDREIGALEALIEARARTERARAARAGHPLAPPPCGTEEGYQWHRHRHEQRDPECLAAHAAHERSRVAAHRPEGGS